MTELAMAARPAPCPRNSLGGWSLVLGWVSLAILAVVIVLLVARFLAGEPSS